MFDFKKMSRQDTELQAWLREARLDGFTNPDTPIEQATSEQKQTVMAALQKLQGFIAEAEAVGSASN
ncbi:MAG: hypothetical protein ACI82A_001962 [Candidatus Azotimanducaceae bacterium]|jgi:hypothetical protein